MKLLSDHILDKCLNEMNIGIIGLGLIGGSMAIDLRRRGHAGTLLGVDRDPVNGAAAEKIGLVDRVVPLRECVLGSDVIIVAVPAGAAVEIIPEVLDLLQDFSDAGSPEKTVMDVCSTKLHIARAVCDHPMRQRYVASHPMSGTEYSGPWAALPGLFDGRACIICDASDSAPDAVKAVEDIYKCLDMRIVHMDSQNHDVHTAYISHFSHVISFALALTVLEKEKDDKHIFDLASGGFSSTVRLAKSSADMWTPILLQNKDNVLHVMDTYMDMLEDFRKAMADSDEGALRRLIEDANRIRRIIR